VETRGTVPFAKTGIGIVSHILDLEVTPSFAIVLDAISLTDDHSKLINSCIEYPAWKLNLRHVLSGRANHISHLAPSSMAFRDSVSFYKAFTKRPPSLRNPSEFGLIHFHYRKQQDLFTWRYLKQRAAQFDITN
jgi:hypothetical protein